MAHRRAPSRLPFLPPRIAYVPARLRALCVFRQGGAAFFWLAIAGLLASPVAATVRITDDDGGKIGTYYARYMALRASGEQVVIDGKCASACTMVLGLVPPERICVTANAKLGFHAAYRRGFLGFEVINDPATRTLWSLYPAPVQDWISRHGGLGLAMIYLSGPELFAMYRQCR